MFICMWCPKTYDSYNSLGKHTSRTHSISRERLRIEYFHDGIAPLCACGCETLTKYHSSGFMTYVTGHNSRVANPMSGKNHSDEARSKMSTIASDEFASGKRVLWATGHTKHTHPSLMSSSKKLSENKERAEQSRQYMKGRPKSESHKANSRAGIIKAWENPELREQQARNRVAYFQSGNCNKVSRIEDRVAEMLDTISITYKRQYYVNDIQALYDFYVWGAQMFIEVHGDYWHCNPATKHATPTYAAQKKNVGNDIKKANWAMDNGIPLLIIWELDIKTRPEWVLTELQRAVAMYRNRPALENPACLLPSTI